MDNPCQYCSKAIEELHGEVFKQWCEGTCEKYDAYANEASKSLDELLAIGNRILKKYGVDS